MLQKVLNVIRDSFQIWGQAKASLMSAALTYYTMISLSPILVLAVAIAGRFYGEALVQGELISQIAQFTSPEVAGTVSELITNTSEPQSGLIAGLLSFGILFYGASGVFTMLHDTFNIIWDVPYDNRSGYWYTIKQRLVGIGMVLSVGLLLVISILLGAMIGVISDWIYTELPLFSGRLYLAERGITFLITPLLFMGINRGLPEAQMTWWDVLIPSFLTAMILLGSRSLIGLYLQFSSTSAVYGAAGSLVVLLVWVYMTGLIVFFGAALCRAFAEQFGSRQTGGSVTSPLRGSS
ncbi:MAG: membrane protein [Cellvibrionaceae bacterium]|jgi:membrane protein